MSDRPSDRRRNRPAPVRFHPGEWAMIVSQSATADVASRDREQWRRDDG
jgi:hypothetical protein